MHGTTCFFFVFCHTVYLCLCLIKFSYAHTKTIRKKYHALADNNNIVMLSRHNADKRTRLSRSRLTQMISVMYICIGTMGYANHPSSLIVSLVAFSRARGAVCWATRSSQWLGCCTRVKKCPIEMTKWQSDALERPTYSWRHLIFRFSHVARVGFNGAWTRWLFGRILYFIEYREEEQVQKEGELLSELVLFQVQSRDTTAERIDVPLGSDITFRIAWNLWTNCAVVGRNEAIFINRAFLVFRPPYGWERGINVTWYGLLETSNFQCPFLNLHTRAFAIRTHKLVVYKNLLCGIDRWTCKSHTHR